MACCTVLELYALSRHRCCSLLFLDDLHFVDGGDDRLTTTLSITSVTNFLSWVFADDITTDSGMPFLSVKMCLFVPSLLLSVGLLPVIAPLRATLLICCQWIASSTWFLFCYHIFLAAWSTSFWKHLAWPISETAYGRWSQNHILWAAFSTGIRF